MMTTRGHWLVWKLKERPLPKEKSVKDQQEECQDEYSEMKEAEEEEDSSECEKLPSLKEKSLTHIPYLS